MKRRTTFAAAADDLAVLRDEAARRGVSLSHVVGEAVERFANELRRRRRPRFGIARSSGGAAQAALARPDEPYEAHQPKG